MGVRVRLAARTDFQAACRLWAEADALHAAEISHLFRSTDRPARSRRAFVANLNDTDHALFLAELEGAVVALVRVQVFERLESSDVPALVARMCARIEELVVAQAHQRRGIATRLMSAAHRRVLDRGITEIELNVFEFNEPALRLYSKLGYSPASRRLRRKLD